MTLISEQKFTVSRFQLITMVAAIFGLVMAGVTNAQVSEGQIIPRTSGCL